MKRSLKTLLSGLITAGVTLVGASVWAVEVTEDIIREQVMHHVQSRLAPVVPTGSQGRLLVNVLKVPLAPFQFDKVQKLSQIKILTESRLGEIYSERAIVRVRLCAPNGLVRDIGVPVEISVSKPVWVVKNIVGAGQPLHTSDFALQVREVDHTYGYVVGNERPIEQYVARVNLNPGEILDSRKLSIPPDVRYNDEVRIIVSNNNGMTVTVPGIALNDGKIGETIRVRQDRFQRKYFMAKVIDKNRVLVEM